MKRRLLLALTLAAGTAVAQDEPENNEQTAGTGSGLQSTITGNQQQPQVLYIVPWQSPESPTLKYNVARDQSQKVYGHIERSELARELANLPAVAPPGFKKSKEANQVPDGSQPDKAN